MVNWLDWIEWGYWGIFLLMVLENVIPPIPSEVIMGLGGIAVARGKMDFAMLVAAGTAGTVVGNLFWWEAGRRLGYRRLKPAVDRWGRWLTIEWDNIERLKAYFDRWGGLTVFLFRFLPLGRTMISVPAGLMHMPFWRFTLFTTAGSLVWNVMLAGVGLGLGTLIQDVERWVTPVALAGAAAMLLLYVWRLLTWRPRHRA
ncbi:DedA family protein [Sphingomonas canadensis]|uniref:DedA family protein n=1 Tax=Sphingomonas canadensis TaxID=1219257 RepID=A0ABW3H8Z2_9SPHN|nr:DedA family protein [Sphingomonas canadensis]MCW3837366.1 DedA family protein [Sphingomonas canadensis]